MDYITQNEYDAKLEWQRDELLKKAKKIIDDCEPISKNSYEKFAVPTHLLQELEEAIQKTEGDNYD